MKSGKCPKCDNTNIISNKHKFIKGSHSLIHQTLIGSSIISITFVCTNCGYVEDYIESNNINKLKENWEK